MSPSRAAALFCAAACSLSLACHEIDIDFDSSDAGEIRLYDDLYSVSVADPQNAVAVGYYGAAYFTTDGGQTFEKGDTGTRRSLYSVAMADAQHGWAVGQRGLVMHTEDGGRTWQRQDHPKVESQPHLFSVTAINANTAWVIGEWGTRILTNDGGKTWEDHSFTVDQLHPMFVWLDERDQEKIRKGEPVFEDVTLNDVFCERGDPTSARCWLIGEFGYVFYSDDGGATWQSSSIEGSATMPLIELGYNQIEIDSSDIEIIGDFAESVASETHLNVAIESVASPAEIEAYGRGGDPNELFELLEARSAEVRFSIEDAGVSTDRVRLRAQPPWDYEDYLEHDPDFLERYFRSRENPKGGVRVRVIQNPILFTVQFDEAGQGIIAGLGGVVLVSDDGGKTWTYREMDQLLAVFAAGQVPGRIVAVGEKGFQRTSTDMGATWEPIDASHFPSIFTFMRDLEFAPGGETGFIVGQTGQIFKTTDSGTSWQRVLPPTEASAEGSG